MNICPFPGFYRFDLRPQISQNPNPQILRPPSMASPIIHSPSTFLLPSPPPSVSLHLKTLTLTPLKPPSFPALRARNRHSPVTELGTAAKTDPVYHNRLVNAMVNRILKNGKKSLAHQIMYRAMKRIQEKTRTNPLLVLRQAVGRATPDVAVKAVRVGGRSYQVPVEIGAAQGRALAVRWLLEAARRRAGRDMGFKLSGEVVDAARGSGGAVGRKEETHKMAEANRHNSHIHVA